VPTRARNSSLASLAEKPNSPFTPGEPVPVELFVGRQAQIEEVFRYARQASSGRVESVFLCAERGMGKSSLAQFLRELCSKELNMLGIHVFLGGVTVLDELVRRVFDQLLKHSCTQSWFSKLQALFGGFIRQVGLFNISVTFAPPDDKLQQLVRSFPDALAEVVKKLEEDKSGLLIILDDLNGLADQPEFANWYKSVVDYVATHRIRLPLLMVLCGLPERRDSLSRLQPSLMRIFRVAEIERLTDEEVSDFFSKAFQGVGLKVAADAMKLMVTYSSGLPVLMQEIGDATYWANKDNVIDKRDSVEGISAAARNVGEKYLDPRVYRAMRSQRYRGILDKLVDTPRQTFHRNAVEQRLSEEEKRVFHNFLRKMRDLGVIEPDSDRGRGAYRFVNRIYPLYMYLHKAVPRNR